MEVKSQSRRRKRDFLNQERFHMIRFEGTAPRHSQDDSIISYGEYISLNNNCKCCCNRDSQKVLIHPHRTFHQRLTVHQTTCLDCNRLRQQLHNPKMLRRMGHCVIFILFVLISYFGLLHGLSTHLDKSSYKGDNIELGGPTNVSLDNHLTQKVSLEKFRTMSRKAKSFRDIYRIFFHDKHVPDEKVDKMLTTRSFNGALNKKVRETDEDNYDYMDIDPDGDFNTDIQNVADEAFSHYFEVKEHPLGSCDDPTPELRYIPPEGNKLYFPEYTILHVCKNISGCCWNPAQECGEKEIEIVTKSFIVAELQHSSHGDEVFIPEGNKVEIKFFKNVTKCECKTITPLPRCDKKCPFPFVKTRRGPECVCDCKDDRSLKCLEIKYGIEPLHDTDFDCIKEGKCMKPVCASGELDIRKGYCPGVDNARLRLHYSYNRLKRHVTSGHGRNYNEDDG